MNNALQAIPTEHGLSILRSAQKQHATKYELVGALTPDATQLSTFHSAEIESSYFDENKVLTFVLILPVETDFKEYLHKITILDSDSKVVIECATPKVALAKGIGGKVSLKATITGEAGEIIFKKSDYITEPEMRELWLPPLEKKIDDHKKATEQALANIDFSPYALKVNQYPIGAPILWLSDVLPQDGQYAFMKGQAFDTTTYPELAKVYPDGILDTMQGLGIMGKHDDETVGAVEEGQVKRHGHTGSADSVDLGTKVTNKSGRHRHLTLGASNGGWNYSAGNYQGVSRGSSFSQKYTNYVDDHDHVVELDEHGHTVTIHPTGAEKNTIDHRKFNFIVRMK